MVRKGLRSEMKVDISKYDEDFEHFEHLETVIRHKQKSRNRLKNTNRDPNRRKGKGKKRKTWRDSKK